MPSQNILVYTLLAIALSGCFILVGLHAVTWDNISGIVYTIVGGVVGTIVPRHGDLPAPLVNVNPGPVANPGGNP